MTVDLVVIAAASFGAAAVNGAIGYGYASITVPIALLVVAGRTLSPALVLVEVAINLYALWWCRHAIVRVLPRVAPLVLGLVPGVVIGALLLGSVAPTAVKIAALGALLPLIVLQATGRRWRIRRERRAAVSLGTGVGVLYGVTAISGPPLAVFWNNQGLAQDDFKVALATVKALLALCAVAIYAALGLVTTSSAELVPWLAPGVLLGLPLGHALLRRVELATFRRLCTSFDAYLVAFGLSRALIEAGVAPAIAYQLLAATVVLDAYLLRGYFRRARTAGEPRLALEAA